MPFWGERRGAGLPNKIAKEIIKHPKIALPVGLGITLAILAPQGADHPNPPQAAQPPTASSGIENNVAGDSSLSQYPVRTPAVSQSWTEISFGKNFYLTSTNGGWYLPGDPTDVYVPKGNIISKTTTGKPLMRNGVPCEIIISGTKAPDVLACK